MLIRDVIDMLDSPISKLNKKMLSEAFAELEKESSSDVIVFYGEFTDDIDGVIKELIEELAFPNRKSDNLYFVLTTNGGSLLPVIRIVNVLRHYYNTIDYYIPDHAYSAGTIMCCSGDRIFMDYYSVLGPIDPQMKSKDGHFVSVLGYLDKLNELLEKAKNNTITNPEFMILKDFDLGEWRDYEQTKDLTIDLLSDWLPKYKFKDWEIHNSNSEKVTQEYKEKRAKEIATILSDNSKWKSHGRPINREELEKLKLRIDKMENNQKLYDRIKEHNQLMVDYMNKNGLRLLIQTRNGVISGR